MDDRAAEVWRHAPAIYDKLECIASQPKEKAREELLAVLGMSPTSPGIIDSGSDSVPSVEEFEYAMHTSLMRRLEVEEADEAQLEEVASMLDAMASVVAELFERAADSMSTAETEKCKAWWSMLLSFAEDVARLLPLKFLTRLVEDFESSLVSLRAAYLQLAKKRLQEFDLRQDVEAKAAEEGETGAAGGATKEASEAKRYEDRKRLITHLGISPNGQLYLTLTSLLKQLSSRLCSSLHAPLRARIVLLLEKLLAMDHKAIANNQKLRTQEYIQAEDLDPESEAQAVFGLVAVPSPAVEVVAITEGEGDVAEAKTEALAADAKEGATAVETPVTTAVAPAAKVATTAASLGADAAVDYGLYKSFWGLQEALQHPERLFERRESWANFHRALSVLLQLFLKYPVQSEVRQPWMQPEPQPLRQAPRAKALAVQLDDPGFRQQFLTQVMIAFQALEQDGRRDAGGLISKQQEAVKSEFHSLKKLCETALGQTREGFPEMLRHVLDREAHWVAWKSAGCREFERESLEMLQARATPVDSLPRDLESVGSSKPRLPTHVNSLLKALKDPKWRVPPAQPSSDEDALKDMRPHAMRGMCDAYLDRLIDEDKPENGIEEEYKAKKNKVFMWQCRRLFCQQYLRAYAQKDLNGKTDFMDFVRTVKGKPLAACATAATGEDATAAAVSGTAEEGLSADMEVTAGGEGSAAFGDGDEAAVVDVSVDVAEVAAPVEDAAVAVPERQAPVVLPLEEDPAEPPSKKAKK